MMVDLGKTTINLLSSISHRTLFSLMLKYSMMGKKKTMIKWVSTRIWWEKQKFLLIMRCMLMEN